MKITFEIIYRVFGWTVEIRSRPFTGLVKGVFVSDMDTLTVKSLGQYILLSRRDQTTEQRAAEQAMIDSWDND